jgi:hypothetical protein
MDLILVFMRPLQKVFLPRITRNARIFRANNESFIKYKLTQLTHLL